MKKITKIIALSAILTASATSVSAVGLGAWAGYNFATGIDTTTCEALKGTTGECTKGGVAFGGDLWLFGIPGIPIQLGVGGAYVPVTYQKYVYGSVGSGNNAGSTYTLETSTKFIPVYAQARVDLMGFFAGVTVGYGISISTAAFSSTASSIGTPSAAGAAFGIGGFAGYGIGLGPLSIEAGARVFSLSSSFNIMPFVGVTLKI